MPPVMGGVDDCEMVVERDFLMSALLLCEHDCCFYNRGRVNEWRDCRLCYINTGDTRISAELRVENAAAYKLQKSHYPWTAKGLTRWAKTRVLTRSLFDLR